MAENANELGTLFTIIGNDGHSNNFNFNGSCPNCNCEANTRVLSNYSMRKL